MVGEQAMIIRIFRVRIYEQLREEFEGKFATVSVKAVEAASGLQSVSIYRPTEWSPDDYAMVSIWNSEDDVRYFAGEDWNKAFIPPGMDKYIAKCWIDHFQSW